MAEYTESQIRAVRLLIPDTEAIYGEYGEEYIFDEADIAIYLDLGQGNATWAAGLASLAIGGSEALIGKWIRNYETQTNGPAAMREWTAKGKLMVEQGKAEVADGDVGIFEVAFPGWGPQRHPEGYTHGSYRRAPGSYQW